MITDSPKLTNTGCLVSILPLGSIQIYSYRLYAAYKKRTSQIFGNVRCPILGKPRTPLCCLATDMEENQTELETENK